MAAFRQAIGVQSGIVGNVREDAEALKGIVARSQGAEGSLQATQATLQTRRRPSRGWKRALYGDDALKKSPRPAQP
ncbi:MAG: hypothetical protein EOP62_02915 [Sphingomonadales bacterium]|nr:MAG: hypothetical protein EOP62_02915 [Sphingomonadales bacterium]